MQRDTGRARRHYRPDEAAADRARSRDAELAAEFPLHVVTEWIGNSSTVALKHYLTVTDDDFARAAKGGAISGALEVQKAAQHPPVAICADLQKRIPSFAQRRSYANGCDDMRTYAYMFIAPLRTRT
jgi:hypothetical protein